jgi:hypothetical protein
MKYISNIITKTNLDLGDYINVNKTIENIDTNIPTLIIGWENTKKIFPNANILNKHISDTISWTFSNREKRQEYEPDLNKFLKLSFERLDKDVKYIYFNVLTNKLSKIKGLVGYINSQTTKVIYVSDKNIYIYDGKQVIGISLSDLEYYGFKRDRIIKFISKNVNNKVITNDNFINWKIKRIIGDNNKLIPYLYSLKYDIL